MMNVAGMEASELFGCVLFALVCLQRPVGSERVNTVAQILRELSENSWTNTNQETSYTSWIAIKRSVKFWLHTRERPDDSHQLIVDDPETLWSSPFNETNPTKVLVHGWLGNEKDARSVCSKIKFEYFALDDYNVVCVEWTSLALDWPYFTAGIQSKNIGNRVADLITMMTNYTTQTMENIHIIGLSMGAHIAGFAGKKLEGQVHRITGLDPAKPFFPANDPSRRLSKDDATFVDVVHTTSILLGQHRPIGVIDFYPNGGNTKQPGCGFEYVYGEVCSHFKALEFYALSIREKEKFKSIKCDSWDDYTRSSCNDGDEYTYLGEYADSGFSGNFYLTVS